MGSIHKGVSPNSSYTKIPNELIRNSQIGDSTFRFICWVTSHNEGFSFSFNSVKAKLGYGREKLRTIIKQAEVNAYLVRIRSRDEKGQIDWDYYVFADKEECETFRESRLDEIYQGGLNPSLDETDLPGGANPPMETGDLSRGVKTTGGSASPHKKTIQRKKIKNLIKREEEISSTPAENLPATVENFPEPILEVTPVLTVEPELNCLQQRFAIEVEIIESISALEQIVIPGQSKPETIPQTENLSLTQYSAVPLMTAQSSEIELRKAVEKAAWNADSRPWRMNPLEFRPEVGLMVYQRSKDHFTLPGGSINFIYIQEHLEKLEASLKKGDAEAVKAYQKLMNYCKMADMEAQGLDGKKIMQQQQAQQQQAEINDLVLPGKKFSFKNIAEKRKASA